MKKYTELELKDILEKHSLWLREDRNGERANLRGADLGEADLSRANLSRLHFFISRQEAVDFKI